MTTSAGDANPALDFTAAIVRSGATQLASNGSVTQLLVRAFLSLRSGGVVLTLGSSREGAVHSDQTFSKQAESGGEQQLAGSTTEKVDVLTIDGSSLDTQMFSSEQVLSNLSASGVLLIHSPSGLRGDDAVSTLWAELVESHPTQAIELPLHHRIGLFAGEDNIEVLSLLSLIRENSAMAVFAAFLESLGRESNTLRSEAIRLDAERERLDSVAQIVEAGAESTSEFRKENERLRRELVKHEGRHAALMESLNKMKSTRSWRLTAPLRWLEARLKSITSP